MDANSPYFALSLSNGLRAGANWLLKTVLRSTRPQAVLAVGLRQKALRQRFLIATTASKVFSQPIPGFLVSY
jgi:hypothetical protein